MSAPNCIYNYRNKKQINSLFTDLPRPMRSEIDVYVYVYENMSAGV